jgi:putative transcriptional regulator
MPGRSESRLQRAVIYLCDHDGEGAMGLAVNRPAPQMSFADVLIQTSLRTSKDDIVLPPRAVAMPVLLGGPRERDHGFVLHSTDYALAGSQSIKGGVSLTSSCDILRAIAAGGGPVRAVLAFGYSQWRAGQLEREISQNEWLVCPFDEGILFGDDLDAKHLKAMLRIGVDPAALHPECGRA